MGTAKSADHFEIAGRTMGIVGLGGIGRAIARTAHHGFNMRVIATDVRHAECPEFVAELHPPEWFPDLLPQSDVVVAAAPLMPQTRQMFNESAFRRMKPSAYLPGGFARSPVRRHGTGKSTAGKLDCRSRFGRLSGRSRLLLTIRFSIVRTSSCPCTRPVGVRTGKFASSNFSARTCDAIAAVNHF